MVRKVEVSTPLIAPSFSSRGFPQINEIWETFRHKLHGACLVSAFDMAAGRVSADAVELVNVVILDSGLYESSKEEEYPAQLAASSLTVDWTREKYHEVVEGLGRRGNVMLVNFDQAGEIDGQIARAVEDFSHAAHAASDFLIKPPNDSPLVNLPKLGSYQECLGQFDVIGITAREVGSTLLERCNAVVTLRDLLDEAGLKTPIHVFGAISPYEVLAYFLCGADIFDGLNWLRFAFRNHASIAIGESALEDLKWQLTDSELFTEVWTDNLRFLYHLQEALREYTLSRDSELLMEEFPVARQVAQVAEIAGAEI